MTNCLYCDKPYIARDEDAGETLEHFCSKECEEAYEEALSNYIGELEELDDRF